MNPVLAEPGRRGVYLLLWLPVAALLVAALRLVGAYSWLEAAFLVTPLVLGYAFVCPGAYYVCRAQPLHLAGLPGLIGTHVATAGLTAALWVVLGGAWAYVLQTLGLLPPSDDAYVHAAPILFGAFLLIFLLCSTLFYLLISHEASRDFERRALEVQVLSRDAELKTLRAQIHPHFLFNALNSINALVKSDPDGARRVCVLLADFLRQSLTVGGHETITLDDELSLVEKLLSIETVRFGDRLRYRIEADAQARACLVPPLVLQPLVENAVTHGVAHLLEGGEIRVRALRRGDRLELWVENPRDAEAPTRHGAGVGLDNVRKRLAALFGDDGQMSVQRDAERFSVALQLPARAIS
jgi:two-component system, LytTR family, sensor histidine kinase AlgZ